MEARTEKTLVIETGILCNNRCTFCYQHGYRRISRVDMLVPRQTIQDRMEWGIANGFSELSLTGGEPTIRKDFIDIVRSARDIGYQRVAVTTNGNRLSDVDFFRQAVSAGLDGMGVSIHGGSSHVHDQVTGRPGSFLNAVKAIRNGVKATRALGEKRFRLNTFTVLHAGIIDDLPAFTAMLAMLGVRLMILQPAITGKSNVSPVDQVELGRLIDAIRTSAMAGASGGYRLKPFNIPPCLLADVAEGLDLTMYGRLQFRESDHEDPSGHIRGQEVGFVRFPACADCRKAAFCSGINVALLPDADLLQAFKAIDNTGEAPIWVTGTELLSAEGIWTLLHHFGDRQVVVCTGGTHRAGAGLFAAIDRFNDPFGHRLGLVYQPRDPGSSDRIIRDAGNGEWLIETVRAAVGFGFRGGISIVGSSEHGFAAFLGMVRDFMRDCGSGNDIDIFVAGPGCVPGGSPAALEEIARIAGDWSAVGRLVLIAGQQDTGWRPGFLSDESKTTHCRFQTVNAINVPSTAFDGKILSLLNWSVPPGTDRSRDIPPDFLVRSLDVKPF